VSAADDSDYELVLAPPARRAIADRPPEPVAAAVIDFVTTALIARPKQVGKPLRDDLAGVWSARRGTYRILHRVLDGPREIVVLRIEHRRDVYRPH
jgi:mRNA interferase RelE/StbE